MVEVQNDEFIAGSKTLNQRAKFSLPRTRCPRVRF